MPFNDMCLKIPSHPKSAAKIAAKLLLVGFLRDLRLLAWLVLIYFDTPFATNYHDEGGDDDVEADYGTEIKEVSSPICLQQFLEHVLSHVQHAEPRRKRRHDGQCGSLALDCEHKA